MSLTCDHILRGEAPSPYDIMKARAILVSARSQISMIEFGAQCVQAGREAGARDGITARQRMAGAAGGHARWAGIPASRRREIMAEATQARLKK